MQNHRPLRALLTLALCVFINACSSDNTSPSEANVTVTVEPANVELVSGQTQQFTASVAGTNLSTVNWTATGGTITTGGLFTAGSEPGVYTVTATSAVSTKARAEAEVLVRKVGVVIPVWNRSRAYAGAAEDSKVVNADSANFSGFEAKLSAASSTGSATTEITAAFHRDAGTEHLYLVESETFTNVNNTMPPDGTPGAFNHLHLVFEVRDSPVGFTFTATCTFWGFDAIFAKTNHPTRRLFDYDIMDGEFDDGDCDAIEESGVLQPGIYEFYVTHTINTPWAGLEPGTFVERKGGYTMRLEFDQTPDL